MAHKPLYGQYHIQIIILLAVCFAADIIANLMPFAFPVNVTAMLLLLLLLGLGVVKLGKVETIGDLLIYNMNIMFLPSSCALMISYKYILDRLPSFIFICLASTFITWFATYFTICLVIKIQNSLHGRKAGAENE